MLVIAATGCDDLDGRAANRKGKRRFNEARFIDAAALFEHARTKVTDDRLEYNLGLAYSRVFKGGTDELVLLAQKDEDVCRLIPGTQPVTRRVCIKLKTDEEDRAYPDCDEKQICPSSAECRNVDLCAIPNKALATLAADHLGNWIAKQAPDDEINKNAKSLAAEIEKLEAARDAADAEATASKDEKTGAFLDKVKYESAMRRKSEAEAVLKVKRDDIEETRLKFTMRLLMTNMWLDSSQFDKALAFWEGERKQRPTEFEPMNKLAGINLQSGDWKAAVNWYLKMGETLPDESGKISALNSVGNLAWAKLNGKQLNQTEAVELADLAIGALQRGAELAPKNLMFLRLQTAILNFRALAHGVSWAGSIDRAHGQDLKFVADVLSGKPPAAVPPKTPTPAPTPAPATGSGAPSDAGSGSAAPAAPAPAPAQPKAGG